MKRQKSQSRQSGRRKNQGRVKPRSTYPLVSVALATYNGEQFLERLLESVVRQGYPNLEVVAVDDHSKDATRDILRTYRSSLQLRLYGNKERIGFVRNFERAISLCKGEFIALADQDDIWMPQKLRKLLDSIGPSSLVCSDLALIDEKDREISPSLREFQGLTIPPERDEFRHLVLRNYVTGSSLLFRRELLKRTMRFPAEMFTHDWWLALHASCAGGIRYIGEPLTLYRQHSQNAIGAKKRPTFVDAIRFALSTEERSREYEEERKRFHFLLEQGVFPNGGGREYLSDLIQYCDSHLESWIHTNSAKIAFKYRDVFFPGMGPLKRSMFLLVKLFG